MSTLQGFVDNLVAEVVPNMATPTAKTDNRV